MNRNRKTTYTTGVKHSLDRVSCNNGANRCDQICLNLAHQSARLGFLPCPLVPHDAPVRDSLFLVAAMDDRLFIRATIGRYPSSILHRGASDTCHFHDFSTRYSHTRSLATCILPSQTRDRASRIHRGAGTFLWWHILLAALSLVL